MSKCSGCGKSTYHISAKCRACRLRKCTRCQGYFSPTDTSEKRCSDCRSNYNKTAKGRGE